MLADRQQRVPPRPHIAFGDRRNRCCRAEILHHRTQNAAIVDLCLGAPANASMRADERAHALLQRDASRNQNYGG